MIYIFFIYTYINMKRTKHLILSPTVNENEVGEGSLNI